MAEMEVTPLDHRERLWGPLTRFIYASEQIELLERELSGWKAVKAAARESAIQAADFNGRLGDVVSVDGRYWRVTPDTISEVPRR